MKLITAAMTFRYNVIKFEDKSVYIDAKAVIEGNPVVKSVKVTGVPNEGVYKAHETFVLSLVFSQLFRKDDQTEVKFIR